MSRPLVAVALVGSLALAGCAGGTPGVESASIPLVVAYDVNEAGVIVGATSDPQKYLNRAWAVDATTGQRRELVVPAGDDGWAEVHGLAVNETGTVVGSVDWRPYRWNLSTGAGQPLGSLPERDGGEATDVNDAGFVVGYTGTPAIFYATAWEPGSDQPRRLPTLGGAQGRANQVNDHGLAVGASTTDDTTLATHAVSWDLAAGTIRRLQEPTWATRSEALAVNDTGDIVGIVESESGDQQLARWDAATGAVRVLGPRGARGNGVVRPTAVNDRGIVVGDKGHLFFNPSGFGLDTSATRVDLATGATIDLAPKISNARGIDDDGLVVGWVRDGNGVALATRWTLRP